MITYNHEKFIRQAILSVVNQKTNFHFKIFLGEDCSSDLTREICKDLQVQYPDKIELFLPNTNLGVYGKQGIVSQIYCRCFESGAKYIALLEGDDYWGDVNKLQSQVDFLEVNHTFGSTYHRSSVVNEFDELLKEDKRLNYKDHRGPDLVLGKGEMLTNTIMFRNNITPPKSFYLVPNGDTFLWHLIGFLGDCKFQSEIKPSAYRIHAAGVWSNADYSKKAKALCITYNYIFQSLNKNGLDTSYVFDLVCSGLNKYLLSKLRNMEIIEYFSFLNYTRQFKFVNNLNFYMNHVRFIFFRFSNFKKTY